MKLDKPIIIQPPPYTNSKTGKIVYPDPITLQSLQITYIDNPNKKKLAARIDSLPYVLPLTESDQEYDDLGDYSSSIRETLVKNKLGPDPAAKIRSLFPPTLEEYPNGPGTILSNIIKNFGIAMTPNCKCMQHAMEMNTKGPEWCEQNIDLILDWIKEEAENRKLPFVSSLVRMAVVQAINKAKKYVV